MWLSSFFLTQESPASCPLQAEIGCASELFSARSRTPSATCCKPQFGGQTQPAANNINNSSISPNNLKLQHGETRISWDHLFNAYHFSYLYPFIYSVTILDKSAKTRHCQDKDCRFTSRLHLQGESFCWKPHRPQPDSSRFTCLCYGSISIPGIPWWYARCSKTRTAERIIRTNGDRFKRLKASITAKPEQPAKFEEERTTWWSRCTNMPNMQR